MAISNEKKIEKASVMDSFKAQFSLWAPRIGIYILGLVLFWSLVFKAKVQGQIEYEFRLQSKARFLKTRHQNASS